MGRSERVFLSMKAAVLLTYLTVSLASASAARVLSQVSSDSSEGWQAGRATFYGGSAQYLRHFPSRGPPPEYGFGSSLYGSCGYTSQEGTEGVSYANVPFPVDTLAAAANINADYPGSCGRCYEVRCVTGVVVGNFSSTGDAIPFNTSRGFTEPGLDLSTVQDDYGRTYAGNPLRGEEQLFTQCWNNTLGLTTPSNSIYVTVTDNCPCDDGRNPPCCGNAPPHFDLSFFAFEKIAHPVYGVQNLEFRPVDCSSRQPLQYAPGFINETIYSDNVETGWSWNAYQQTNKQLQVAGAGVGGSNATCVAVKPQGGLTFIARSGSTEGYQPFIADNADTVSFYVKETSVNDVSTAIAAVPPNVEISIGNAEEQYYCQGQQLSDLTRGPTADGLIQLTAPLSSFNCDLSRVDQVGFQNVGASSVAFCLDDVALTGGSPPSRVLAGASPSALGDYPGAVTPLTSTAV